MANFVRSVVGFISGVFVLVFLGFMVLVVAPILGMMYDNCVIPRPKTYHYEAGETYKVCEKYTFDVNW